MKIEWEKIVEGMTETWVAKVDGGHLYRVDIYIQHTDDRGHEYYTIGATTMTFVPGVI